MSVTDNSSYSPQATAALDGDAPPPMIELQGVGKIYPGSDVPAVADLDGDGEPEIGIADSEWYWAFETDGSLKWQAPTSDCSSASTGSTVFDFDGDGAADLAVGVRGENIGNADDGGAVVRVSLPPSRA